jgi:hypothetical protein
MNTAITAPTSAFNTSRILTLEEAVAKAPAIAATRPADHINLKRYKFTPTTEVISHMNDLGFVLTDAKQSKTNLELRQNYGTHIVTFQHPELSIKGSDGKLEAKPTVVLVNSHDGVTPIKFEMGMFRLVCSNGLMIKDQDFGGFRERHTKMDFSAVRDLISEKIEGMQTVVNKISKWNGVEMTQGQRTSFAIEALAMRLSSDRQPENYEINEILSSRRREDDSNSLWHVFNRVQENLIKGGYQMNNRTARPITNPIQDMTLNQGLWQIAEAYAN